MSVIELNGKQYDATTGAFLGKSNVIPKHIMQGKAIDGFMRPAHPSAAKSKPTAATKPLTPAQTTPMPKKIFDQVAPARKIPITAPKPIKAHRPERAKTLMRRSVHKPHVTMKPAIKLQVPAEVMAKPQSALQHKRSAYALDTSRLERAVQTDKHHAIRHFQPTHKQTVTHSTSSHIPVITVQPAPAKIITAPTQPQAHTATHHDDIFEKALARATSHQQPAHRPAKRRSKRLINALAVVGTFVVIGGFVGYLNLTSIQLQVASMQVGFSASMPDYTPTGYALQGNVKRSGSLVSLQFQSGDSHYTITQQASNWNSQTLLDNTLALTGAHETVQKNGQTIYIYGDGANAAWVNGGIRYDISGNASLSNDEIATIATSL